MNPQWAQFLVPTGTKHAKAFVDRLDVSTAGVCYVDNLRSESIWCVLVAIWSLMPRAFAQLCDAMRPRSVSWVLLNSKNDEIHVKVFPTCTYAITA